MPQLTARLGRISPAANDVGEGSAGVGLFDAAGHAEGGFLSVVKRQAVCLVAR